VDVWEWARARQERGFCREREREREYTLEHQNQVRKGGEEELIFIQIYEMWLVYLQAGDWRLKYAWIGSKLGELFPYFEYFDPVTQFMIWVSDGSDLRAVLSVRPLKF
jgi:hypothetical protein